MRIRSLFCSLYFFKCGFKLTIYSFTVSRRLLVRMNKFTFLRILTRYPDRILARALQLKLDRTNMSSRMRLTIHSWNVCLLFLRCSSSAFNFRRASVLGTIRYISYGSKCELNCSMISFSSCTILCRPLRIKAFLNRDAHCTLVDMGACRFPFLIYQSGIYVMFSLIFMKWRLFFAIYKRSTMNYRSRLLILILISCVETFQVGGYCFLFGFHCYRLILLLLQFQLPLLYKK